MIEKIIIIKEINEQLITIFTFINVKNAQKSQYHILSKI